jgi:hypothetical protein
MAETESVYYVVRTESLSIIQVNLEDQGSAQGQSGWKDWIWERLFSQYFFFSLSISLHQFSILILTFKNRASCI